MNKTDIIKQYNLESFEVTVQSYIRTFIDKLFALCDYYLSNNINEHSRHLYDLHKIYPLNAYRLDYENRTSTLLIDDIEYKDTISSLSDIVKKLEKIKF